MNDHSPPRDPMNSIIGWFASDITRVAVMCMTPNVDDAEEVEKWAAAPRFLMPQEAIR